MTTSAWSATSEAPHLPPLDGDTEADVVVVGGGITGVTTAYLAARDGRSVVLLDQAHPGAGMTGHTTAHLTAMQDRPFIEIEKVHDRSTAIHVGQSHMEAIGLISRIVEDHRIDCDLARIDGHLVDTTDKLAGNDLMRELHLLHEIGIDGAEALSEGEAPIVRKGRALRLPGQGRMHALHYLYGLLRAAQEKGVRVHAQTHVSALHADRVETSGGHRVRAEAIVLATHTPLKAKRLALALEPQSTYAIGIPVPRGRVADTLVWDTEDPYHYVRLQPWHDDQDLLIVGGADHRPGDAPGGSPQRRWRLVEAWTREHLDALGPVTLRWKGEVFDPTDGLAYIGRSPEHDGETYVATGFAGNGITHGTIAGMLIADRLAGRDNAWADTYDPSRLKGLFTRRSLMHNVQAGKHFVMDRLSRDGPTDASAVRPGQGAVIRVGTAHHAVYRHEDGRLEAHSAVCSHLGCLVQWDDAGKAFACPCHGSRFAPDGSVRAGPAIAPLKPVDAARVEEKETR